MKQLIGWMLLWSINVSAQIPDEVQQEVDLRVLHKHNPSIALAVYQDGQPSFYVKGWQNQQQQIPATIDTVYEIGSITKTFTGLLLAIMTEEKQTSLESTVEQYWEPPFKLKDAEEQPITLKQLSTHTSGLPRMPNNIAIFADDPYGTYDRKDLIEGIAAIQPGKAGSNYAYSNLAVGLLGETLANIGGLSYNELIQQKILNPLSLQATYLSWQDVPKDLLATGYMGNKPTHAWNFKALAGAGFLRSSITDLLAYGVAYIQQPESLKAAMDSATTTQYQQSKLRVGLGWHINDDIIWHNGGTAGFRSILLINPKANKVVAAITNHNQHDVEDLAIHLMDSTKPMRKLDFPVDIDSSQITAFIGRYEQPDSDLQIDIKVINKKLYFTAPKQPKQAMIYLGDDRFKLKLIDVIIKFNRDGENKIDSLTLHGWGQPQTYQKKE